MVKNFWSYGLSLFLDISIIYTENFRMRKLQRNLNVFFYYKAFCSRVDKKIVARMYGKN